MRTPPYYLATRKKSHQQSNLPTLLLFTGISAATLIQAQTPTPVRLALYATVEDVAFYIAGGNSNGIASNQFAALDLTAPSWNTTDPPWTILPSLPAPLVNTIQQGALIQSQSTFFVVAGGQNASTFDLKSRTWSSLISTLPTTFDGAQTGLFGLTDPGSDKVIVPGGYRTPEDRASLQTVLYDVKLNQVELALGPAQDYSTGVPVGIRSYAAVWSTVRGTVLMFGGRGEASLGSTDRYTPNANLLEFSTVTRAWTLLKTTGTAPPHLIKPCFVSAYKGTKMVLFGGVGTSVSRSLYILDTKTLVWTKGQDVSAAMKKFDHSCTTAGDSFIAWGGTDGSIQSEQITAPAVYDMVNNRWTNRFALKQTLTATDPFSPDNSRDPNDSTTIPSSSNVGAIAGGVAGGIVVLLAIGFFLYRQKSQKVSSSRSDNLHEAPMRTPEPDRVKVENVEYDRPSYIPPPPTSTSTYSPLPASSHVHEYQIPAKISPRGPQTHPLPNTPQPYQQGQDTHQTFDPSPSSPSPPLSPTHSSSFQGAFVSGSSQPGRTPLSPHAVTPAGQVAGVMAEEEVQRQIRIRQQELEQLELAQEILQKRLEIEELNLLMAQRPQ